MKTEQTPEEARRQYKNLAEEAIDKYGLQQTLEMISEICWDKAEHIRANWQDKKLAKVWENASRVVSSASTNPAIRTLL